MAEDIDELVFQDEELPAATFQHVMQALDLVPGTPGSAVPYACTLCHPARGFHKFQALLAHVDNIHKSVTVYPSEMLIGTCSVCSKRMDASKSRDGRCSNCPTHPRARVLPTLVPTEQELGPGDRNDPPWTPAPASRRKRQAEESPTDNRPHGAQRPRQQTPGTPSPAGSPCLSSPHQSTARAVPAGDPTPAALAANRAIVPGMTSPLLVGVSNHSPAQPTARAPSSSPSSPLSAAQPPPDQSSPRPALAGTPPADPAGSSPTARAPTADVPRAATVPARAPRTSVAARAAGPPPPSNRPPRPPAQRGSNSGTSVNVAARASQPAAPAPARTRTYAAAAAGSSWTPAQRTTPPPADVPRAAAPPAAAPPATSRAGSQVTSPPTCCNIILPTEAALHQHLKSAHSLGGLIHLPAERITALGLVQCKECLQVVMRGVRHPRDCKSIEHEASASLTSAALRACLRDGLLLSAEVPCAQARQLTWEEIAQRVVVPITKFPASPALNRSLLEVFLAVTKPLLAEQPSDDAWKLFALLPWLLFQRPLSKKPSQSAVLHERFQLLLSGQWDQLYQRAQATEQAWTTLFSRTGNGTQPDPEQRRILRVQSLASQGYLSKATALMCSDAVILDASNQVTRDRVSQLLCSQPYAAPPQAAATPAAFAITAADVKSAVGTSGHAAAGPMGWHIAIFKALVDSLVCQDRIAALLSKMLNAQLPAPMLGLLTAGALTILSKGADAVRPIVTRSTWTRLLGRIIVAQEQRTLAKHLAPIQCGVGQPCGAEFIVHSVREMTHQNPDWAAATFDLANAYGTISRAHVLEQLQSLVPADCARTLQYFQLFCLPSFVLRSGTHTWTMSEGLVQGDPLSPLLFALGVQPALRAAAQQLHAAEPSARLFAYLDDVAVVAPPTSIAATFASLQQHLQAAHLAFKPAKTQLYSAGALDLAPLQQGVGGSVVDVLKVLGTSVQRYAQNHAPTLVDLADTGKIFQRLEAVPSLQVRLLLLRFCLSRQHLHHLRATPAAQAASIAQAVDALVRSTLLSILDVQPQQLTQDLYKECCLPPQLGGLGIPCLLQAQPAAYAASLLSTLQQWRLHVPDQDPLLQRWITSPDLTQALTASAEIVTRAAAILKRPLKYPSSGAEALQFVSTQKLQKKLQHFQQLDDVTNLKSTSLSPAHARAQYISKTCRGASAFLQACPTDRSLLMSNSDMQLTLRMWLRLPVLPALGVHGPTPCLCNSATLLSEEHVFNCGGDAARDVRHNVLVLAFQDMLLATQKNAVHLEPRAAKSGNDQHRFDLAVQGFDSASTNLLLDVTVRSPYADSVVDTAAVTRLAAASRGVSEKLARYSPYKTDSDVFWPLAIETFGGLHHNVFRLIAACAGRVKNAPPDSASFLASTFSAYWLQRLSATLWRENCRLATYICSQSLRLSGLQQVADEDSADPDCADAADA